MLAAPTIKTIALRAIKPYWRNPRDNREAIEKVKQSILDYGYNQLIALDRNDVIIVGHSRYRALDELGWKEASVLVLDLDEKQARAYRIVDNKTSEYSKWTGELATELRELDMSVMQPYFTENLSELLGKSVGLEGLRDVTAKDVSKVEGQLASRFGHASDVYKKAEKEVVCPDCGKVFYLQGS